MFIISPLYLFSFLFASAAEKLINPFFRSFPVFILLIAGSRGEQRDYLTKALQVAQKVPNFDGGEDELAWKNCWNWNLA